MMMRDNSHTEMIQDFAKRTLENYKNYYGRFDVTQLINSMIGLLVFPKEGFEKLNITDDMVDDNILSKLLTGIQKNTYAEKNTLKNIVKHMRNAVSHSHVVFCGEKPPVNSDPIEIKSVKFKDADTRKSPKPEFEMEISIDTLKEFLISFAECIINLSA